MSTAVIPHPPRTMLEVFKSLPEGTRVQLIENNIIMSPAPRDIHQRVLSDIYLQLGSYVKENSLGQTRMAPYDTFFDDGNVYQPDIIFISNERLFLIEDDGLHGAPDMIIEILSPTTAQYDLGKKKDVYEQYGVKEYWTIDPDTKAVQGHFLSDGAFGKISAKEGKISSKLLGVSWDV